jgi:hypothetical protein
LKALLSKSFVSELLQRTPPASLTAQQQAQLKSCCKVIRQLEDALQDAPSLRMQLMEAMLEQQAACSIGYLVTWAQQRPKQLLDIRVVTVAGHQGSAPETAVAGSGTASTWAAGVNLLQCFAVVADQQNSDSAGVCSLAANLTQQLDQSGKACSRNCKCSAQ